MPAAPTRRSFVFFGAFALILGMLWWLWPQPGDDTDPTVTQEEKASEGGGSFKSVRGEDAKPPAWEIKTGSIAGTVTDPTGRAVAGAQVCARTQTDELASSLTREPRCTNTDPKGRYRLSELYAVDYLVSASAPRYRPTKWREDGDARIRLAMSQERTGVDIVLRDGGVLVEGTIMDAAGGVIDGALVKSSGWWGSRLDGDAFTRTDEEGHYGLWVAPGSIRINASAEGYNDGSRSGRAPSGEFDIHLVPESVLVGRVVMLGTEEPVEGARVSTSGEGWMSSQTSAITDAQGRFRLDRLEPGIYKPRAEAAIGVGEAETSVHLGLSETSDEVKIELHPAVTVRGVVVVAGTGEPCTAGGVTLENEDRGDRKREEVGPDGTIEILGVLPGTYEVMAWCDDHVRREDYADVEVADEPVDGLTWEVDAGRAIRGRLVDASGESVAEGRVYARFTGGAPREGMFFGSSGEVQPDGTFEIEGLKAGEHKVTGSPVRSHGIEAERDVEVPADADVEDVVLELPASGAIQGVVEDESGHPVASVEIHTKGPVRGGGRVYTDHEGRFELSPVPVGRHRITARLDWGQTLRKPGTNDDDIQGEVVDVEADETAEVTIVVESTDGSISGRVVDEDGGPVADAFIQTERESDSATAGEGRNRRAVRWGGWNEQPVLTDQDGAFSVDGLTEGAQYTVRAYRKGGGEAVLEHVAEGSTGIELTLQATGRMSGRVVLAGGESPEQFTVTLEDSKQGVHRSDSFFRTRGRFVFESVPPGHYDVTATTAKGDATVEVDLAEGASADDIELELASRVTVVGQLVDIDTQEPVPGMMVNMSPAKGRSSFSFRGGEDKEKISDAQGNFTIDRAPVGRARMMIMPKDFGSTDGYSWTWMKITVADENPYDLGPIGLVKQRLPRDAQAGDLGFELKQLDAGEEAEDHPLTIGFVRPGGPAQAAGLKAGETITAIDGHDVTGENRARFGPLTRVPPATELSFEVQGAQDKRTVRLVAGKPV